MSIASQQFHPCVCLMNEFCRIYLVKKHQCSRKCLTASQICKQKVKVKTAK